MRPISQLVRWSIRVTPSHALVLLGKRSPIASRAATDLDVKLTLMLLNRWFLIAAARVALAQNCSSGDECPERAPCCSEYGWCGTGQAFCLGGCEPFGSYSLDSCSPNPICRDVTTDFRENLDRVLTNGTDYTGDVETHDWVVNAGRLEPHSEGVRLVMTQEGGGTRVSSTRYVHYGTIDFVLKASRWAGVVSAAITMSDVKDEIDLEWAGENTTHVQTNHWFLGVADYNNSQIKEVPVSGDTADEFHRYTIDWQEEYMRWLVDGVEKRRVNKTDTEVEGVFEYPTTPARVQLSLWPGGSEDYAQGTIDWAGGEIDWDSEDYREAGYYWFTIQSVSIQCANITQGDATEGRSSTGWVYTGNMSEGTPEVTTSTLSVELRSLGIHIVIRRIWGSCCALLAILLAL